MKRRVFQGDQAARSGDVCSGRPDNASSASSVAARRASRSSTRACSSLRRSTSAAVWVSAELDRTVRLGHDVVHEVVLEADEQPLSAGDEGADYGSRGVGDLRTERDPSGSHVDPSVEDSPVVAACRPALGRPPPDVLDDPVDVDHRGGWCPRRRTPPASAPMLVARHSRPGAPGSRSVFTTSVHSGRSRDTAPTMSAVPNVTWHATAPPAAKIATRPRRWTAAITRANTTTQRAYAPTTTASTSPRCLRRASPARRQATQAQGPMVPRTAFGSVVCVPADDLSQAPAARATRDTARTAAAPRTARSHPGCKESTVPIASGRLGTGRRRTRDRGRTRSPGRSVVRTGFVRGTHRLPRGSRRGGVLVHRRPRISTR